MLFCRIAVLLFCCHSVYHVKTQRASVDYAVPALKVQDYSLREISKKQLLILIPFTPIRFRVMLRKKRRQERQRNAKSDGKQTLYPDYKNPDYKIPDPDIPDFDYESAKLELTNYFREIILVLDEAVVSGYISESDRKYILALLRKALIRVFHKDKYLLEVVNHMTAPILELDHEKAARLQKELDEKQSILELD
ncbi:MAG: hypothetical protein LUI39_04170, partial [Lachnospiraceae bacterium]|nr:hypothetical protein [Lachnospiraceae bacterium]